MDGLYLFFIVVLIAFFFLKYFSAESPASGTDSEFTWVSRNIDQVLVMFPNANAAAVAYDLSRTRNVEETIEKLLNGSQLPTPPRESRYHEWAQAPPTTPRGQSSATSGSNGSAGADEPTREDLIKRYNLQNRIYTQPAQTEERYEWSKKREEREETLRRRKEEAILSARRKLMEKDVPK